MTEHDSARLAACLARFQQRDPDASEEFQTLAWPYLKNLSRKIAPYLPEDLHDEVAQQTCLYLLKGYKFNPHRASAGVFLPWVVRNAIRKVRADNRPPGLPSRIQKAMADRESELYLAQSDAAISLDQVDVKTHAVLAHNVIIARSELESLLALADPMVADAVQRIYGEGNTLTNTATELGVSRFKLTREIAKFRAKFEFVDCVGSKLSAAHGGLW